MADLYNLDDEIDALQDNQQEEVISNQGEEWDADREELEVPEELQEAAKRKLEDVHHEQQEERVDLEDLLSGFAVENQEKLEDLQYTHLYKAWSQELSSPELLPFPSDTFNEVAELIDAEEDEDAIDTGNANMDALFQSILRIDSERLKFLLSDILKLRLQKIQAHPLHMRSMIERMSDNEVAFLKEYGAAVEHHLRTTVTDHFPQDVWKQLDAEDMIDEPDLDEFVFFKCLENITIDDGTADRLNVQQHEAGTCLIVRYNRIRELYFHGKVELM